MTKPQLQFTLTRLFLAIAVFGALLGSIIFAGILGAVLYAGACGAALLCIGFLKGSKRYRIAGGLLLILLVSFVALTSERGGLAYFSPYTLEYSTQSERTVFGTGTPLYRSAREARKNPLVEMLIEERFVTPQSTDRDRLEVVFHWNDAWRDGDGPLYDLFHRHRHALIEWSLTHKDCARAYWTEGFRLLRSTNYVDIIKGQEILKHCWGATDRVVLHADMERRKAEIDDLFGVGTDAG